MILCENKDQQLSIASNFYICTENKFYTSTFVPWIASIILCHPKQPISSICTNCFTLCLTKCENYKECLLVITLLEFQVSSLSIILYHSCQQVLFLHVRELLSFENNVSCHFNSKTLLPPPPPDRHLWGILKCRFEINIGGRKI